MCSRNIKKIYGWSQGKITVVRKNGRLLTRDHLVTYTKGFYTQVYLFMCLSFKLDNLFALVASNKSYILNWERVTFSRGSDKHASYEYLQPEWNIISDFLVKSPCYSNYQNRLQLQHKCKYGAHVTLLITYCETQNETCNSNFSYFAQETRKCLQKRFIQLVVLEIHCSITWL